MSVGGGYRSRVRVEVEESIMRRGHSRGKSKGQGGSGMGMERGGGRRHGTALGGGDMAGGMGVALPQGAIPMLQASPASVNTNNELTMLRQQAEEMARQTQQIHERIAQLQQAGKGDMTATVDSEKCTGCGACVNVCHNRAICMA